jgi:hypothetical protein
MSSETSYWNELFSGLERKVENGCLDVSIPGFPYEVKERGKK